MSVLSTIRKRAKLLVGAIGAALVIFVLEDALTSGKFFFHKDVDAIAIANGKTVKYQDFRNFVDNLELYNEAARNTTTLDDETKAKITQAAFSEMTNGITLMPQDTKLGIVVTDNEMDELMHGPNFSPEAYRFYFDKRGQPLKKQFIDPKTGSLNYKAMRDYINAVLEKDNSYRADWALTNDDIRNTTLRNKYFYLLFRGLFITEAEAKLAADDANKLYNISYVVKKYADVPDNSVTASEDEMKTWYKDHSYQFVNSEESRRIDYILYPAVPTDKDLIDLQKSVDTLATRFKTTPNTDAFPYVLLNSDIPTVDSNFHKQGTLDNPLIDSAMSVAVQGEVYGPYKENNQYTIAKLIQKEELPDSVKVAHIAIPAQGKASSDWDRAKDLADSIKNAATPENFGELAQKYPFDEETAPNGGDMGWLQLYSKKLWPDEEHAAFFGDKGDIKVIKVGYGYVVVWVEDQSSKSNYIKVAILTKNIEASDETKHDVFAKASAFAGNNSTSDLFEKAAGTTDRRVADVTENEKELAGMKFSKELIRWIYEGKEGDVSGPTDIGDDKYVVAHIMQVSPKGQVPYEQVKDKVKEMVVRDKKAQKIIADFNGNRQGASNIQAFSSKAGLTPSTARALSFQSTDIPGLGKEYALIGTMCGMKPGALSQPIQGELGVYVIQIDSAYTSAQPTDYQIIQYQMQQALRQRVTTDGYDALLKKLNFENHLGKFGF
jgi:peptidyl-prolyl cis-trans isomerase D